ncbi:hypothetical protein [Mesorhizobium sp. L-8-3]|uniref:hypothetical protein n=1 Tax=Mesorhizobium sp. L-8-3 TaxID=2744522 RepID=UPI0019269225|nr:hypothetical protein [Mesorhizobium sp. L-8-3]
MDLIAASSSALYWQQAGEQAGPACFDGRAPHPAAATIAGRRPLAVTTALDLHRRRLAKPVATSVFSPRCGEKVAAAG